MRTIFLLVFILELFFSAGAQLAVSSDKKYLVTKEGKPFFWLGDTAWELFHRLSREEATYYLEDRAEKGFTVIQAVVLAELDGLRTPNYYGHLPLVNEDPQQPNEAYFKHVDFIVRKAAQLGLIIAMLPSWGDKWNMSTWGKGPEVFTPANAKVFGNYLGKRYKNDPIVWMLGGDRNCENEEDLAIIRAMAAGLKQGDGGNHLMTFHPQGGKSSSEFFKDDKWIDFHVTQSGHSSESRNYIYTQKHRQIDPLKPHLDAEPRYEDHPNQFNPEKFGWMDDFDVRQTAYWSVLAGACGHTYGNHNIWQFYSSERNPVSWARTYWKLALDHDGATQVGIMKKFFESRNWQGLRQDNSVIIGNNPEGPMFKIAAVSKDSTFLMVYIPYGDETTINTSLLKGKNLSPFWFNTRDGQKISVNLSDLKKEVHIFKPHSGGRGSDWLLVIDAKP